MDCSKTVLLVATIAYLSATVDAMPSSSLQQDLEIRQLLSSLPLDQPPSSSVDDSHPSPLEAPQTSFKSPSVIEPHSPKAAAAAAAAEAAAEIRQHQINEPLDRSPLWRFQKLVLNLMASFRAEREQEEARKRSWPKSNVHTRLAPFGTKLVPNRNALGNGGSTLFRYGRSV